MAKAQSSYEKGYQDGYLEGYEEGEEEGKLSGYSSPETAEATAARYRLIQNAETQQKRAKIAFWTFVGSAALLWFVLALLVARVFMGEAQ